jgi:hypothetical protein
MLRSYHENRGARKNRFVPMLALIAGVCAGQVLPSHNVLIHLPPGVASENVFIRYVLAGEKFGGWVRPVSGASFYAIGTSVGAIPATGLKAIIYVPGCALRTVDMRVSTSKNEEYSFLCRPLQTIRINGRLIPSDPLYRHGVNLQAKYVARWAHSFLGLADDSVLVIPVGDVSDLSADGRFRISVPDLFRDPVARAADEAGELQIWAQGKIGQNLLAKLIPADLVIATRMGGLRIEREYPSEVVFAPCATMRSPLHDEECFAHRSDIEGCDGQNRSAGPSWIR